MAAVGGHRRVRGDRRADAGRAIGARRSRTPDSRATARGAVHLSPGRPGRRFNPGRPGRRFNPGRPGGRSGDRLPKSLTCSVRRTCLQGTTIVPVEPDQGTGVSYLRDLWHAVQTQDISGRNALLLLTQRPLDTHAVPTNGLSTGPQAPMPEAPLPGAPLPEEGTPGAPLPEDGRSALPTRRHPNSRHPFRDRSRRRRRSRQTVAASLSSSSLFVASRYSATQRWMTVDDFSTLVS